MPKSDDIKIGYKFPFNACEILCCENNTIVDLLVKEINHSKTMQVVQISKEENMYPTEKEQNDSNTLNECSSKGIKNDVIKEIEIEQQENENEEKQIEQTTLKKTDEEKQIEQTTLKKTDEEKHTEEKEDNKPIEENKSEEEKEKQEEDDKIYILDYLLRFVQSSENDNYVLAGYFYKIISHFLDISPAIILQYLYEDHSEHLKNSIKILNKKSIGDFVLKILTYEDSFPKYNTHKIELLTAIIAELKQTQDSEQYEYTMDMLTGALLTPKMFDLLVGESSHLLELLYDIMCNSSISNTEFNSICNFMIKSNKLLISSFSTQKNEAEPSVLFGNTSQSKEDLGNDHFEQEASLVFNLQFVFKILKKTNLLFLSDLGFFDNTDDELQTTYSQMQKRLGMKKLTQSEYIKSLLEIIINSNAKNYYKEDILIVIQLMIKEKVFNNLIDIFFTFPMNNLYQICFRLIIELCINEYSPIELIEHIFDIESLNFNALLIENLAYKRNFNYNSKREINSCTFSVMIIIYNDIMNSSNNKLKELIMNQKDTVALNEILIIAITAVYNKKLLLNESATSFLVHFDSDHKEDNSAKFSHYSIREIIDQHLTIFDEYKQGRDYKQLLLAKILKEKESVIELDDNLNINLDLNDENIFEKRVPFENKSNELFCSSPEVNFSEINRPFEIISDKTHEEQQKDIVTEKKDDYYYDNHYWKSQSINDDALSSLLKDLNL